MPRVTEKLKLLACG